MVPRAAVAESAASGSETLSRQLAASPAQICLRTSSSSDIPALEALERKSYSNPWSRDLLARELEVKHSLRVAALIEGELVAHCFSHLVVDELHILNIAVSPEHRRGGIGKTVLEEVLKRAREKGAVVAYLEVRESNAAAQALYRHFGFTVSGRRKRYYGDNGEDALLMELTLS